MNLPQAALTLTFPFSTILVILKSKLQVAFHFSYTFLQNWLSIKSVLWVKNVKTGIFKHYIVNIHSLITKVFYIPMIMKLILNRQQKSELQERFYIIFKVRTVHVSLFQHLSPFIFLAFLITNLNQGSQSHSHMKGLKSNNTQKKSWFGFFLILLYRSSNLQGFTRSAGYPVMMPSF